MRSRSLRSLASLPVGLLLILALGGASQAAVLVSNLSEPERDLNQIEPLLFAAQSFDTDASPQSLSQIVATVGGEVGSPAPFAELRAATPTGDMDTSPSGLVATLSIPDLSGARSARSFVPSGIVNLAPNTRYFFLLGATGPGSFEWAYAEGNGQVGPALFGPYQYSFDGGVSWTQYGTENPFFMQVEATVATASVLVTNIVEAERDFNTIDSLLFATQSFETDANAYALTEILAIAGGEIGVSGAFAELRASLPTGEMDTSPAGLLGSFTIPDLTGPRSLRSFVSPVHVPLAPSTRYYFLLGAAGPGSFEWAYAEGNGQAGPGVLAQYEYTFDGGSIWTQFGVENPFLTEIRVVPEPSTGAALAVGSLALALASGRRRGLRAV